MGDRNPEAADIVLCGIAGSLREKSFNRALLRAACEVAPDGVELRIFERLRDVPPFDEDVEREGDPEPVVALKQAIREADGLLVVTPEYNHSVPGVLKNALDWASRGGRKAALAGKPAAVTGASPGAIGSARAQVQVREVLYAAGAPTLLRPEVIVTTAGERFDEAGRLVDERSRELLTRLVAALADWARAERGSGA